MASVQSQAGRCLHRRVRVSVGPNSAEQVALAGLERLPEMELQAVKENGIELSSEIFLPRNCALEIEFRLSQGGEPHGPAGSSVQSVRGVVRRVRTVLGAPSYTLWVRPDECQPDEQELSRFLDRHLPGTPG